MPLPLARSIGARALWKAAAAGGWAAWCETYRVSPRADEVHHATTADGWRVAVSRWRAGPRRPEDSPYARRQHPVLLCPGLASNRVGFDLPGRSLALHLAQRGYDTWCVELRGHGLSERPGVGNGRRYGWSLEEYLRFDIPAAVDVVLRASGAEALHWIGHSMGGVLLFASLGCGGARGVAPARLRSAIAVAAAIDYTGGETDFAGLSRLLGLTRVLPAVPFGPLAWVTAPLTGRFATRAEEFNVWPSNIEPEDLRRLHASAFHPVSSPVLAQLATVLREGGLRAPDGARYVDGLARATTPVLALAGDRDRQVSVASIERTLAALGSRRKRLEVFGLDHGQADHYGHFDLLVGRRADREVWPRIEAWLEEHDG